MRPRATRKTIGKTRRRIAFCAWLACFALLLQTVLPIFSRPASAETPPSFAGDLVLCTAHGLAKAADTGHGDANDVIRPLNCPLCQVWQSLSSALPASAANMIGPAFGPSADAEASSQFVPPRYFDPLHARAPPQTI